MDQANAERRTAVKNKIFSSIATVSTVLTMISGCFLDSVSWFPVITTFSFAAIALVSFSMVEEDEYEENVQGL